MDSSAAQQALDLFQADQARAHHQASSSLPASGTKERDSRSHSRCLPPTGAGSLGTGSSTAPGELLAQLLITRAGKVSAQVFSRPPRLQITAQQPFQRIRHLGCQATVSYRSGDLLMQADRTAYAKVVGVFQFALVLDLLAFHPNVGDPMLSAAIGAASHVQFELLVEAGQPLFELIDNPTGKALGLGDGQLAELASGAGDRASPERGTFDRQAEGLQFPGQFLRLVGGHVDDHADSA